MNDPAKPRLAYRHIDEEKWYEVKAQMHGDKRVSVWEKYLEWTPDLMVLYARGNREQMVPMLERLVEVRSRVLGPSHPDTIGTLSNLGGVRYMLGKFVPARDTFREALAAFPKDTDEHDRVLQAVRQ